MPAASIDEYLKNKYNYNIQEKIKLIYQHKRPTPENQVLAVGMQQKERSEMAIKNEYLKRCLKRFRQETRMSLSSYRR